MTAVQCSILITLTVKHVLVTLRGPSHKSVTQLVAVSAGRRLKALSVISVAPGTTPFLTVMFVPVMDLEQWTISVALEVSVAVKATTWD